MRPSLIARASRRQFFQSIVLGGALAIRGSAADAPPAAGQSGMISSAHPLATEAGLATLRLGGNAFDAAVVVASMLNVVEPENSGVGGYGLILLYDARKGQVRTLNASGRIPKAADPEAYRDPATRRGGILVSTPVNLRAWEAMSRAYGQLPWKTVLQSAIDTADRGFELLRPIPADAFKHFPDHAKAFYGREGKPLAKGDRLVQRDLARSLRMIAAGGADVFHGGALGQEIATELMKTGSFVTLKDLAAGTPEWFEESAIEYRGYRIVTPPPPANSFTALIRLGILSQWDLKSMNLDSAAYWHRWAEVTKHGEWCRLKYAGDPDVAPPPLPRLLSSAYWKEQAARIPEDKASEFVPPAAPGAESANTTHFVVADKFGNVVSATQTLGHTFGSRVMARGTGIWLNDSLSYSTFFPPGNPMDVHPGRRKLNSNTPMFAMKDGRPWIVLGASGGHTIPQTVPQVASFIIDHGLDIGQALAAPRIEFSSESGKLGVDKALPEKIREELKERGHRVDVQDFSRVQGLTIEYDPAGKPRAFQGAADPRGLGSAKGY
ncbi:MAG: gamma-glutamyltransferase family protein [Bryobacteraceae bacterium]